MSNEQKLREALQAVIASHELGMKELGERMRASNLTNIRIEGQAVIDAFAAIEQARQALATTEQATAKATPAVPQGEPVLVQHRKPIVGKDGETTGYTSWIDGSGLDWWPHRTLYAAPSQPAVPEQDATRSQLAIGRDAIEYEKGQSHKAGYKQGYQQGRADAAKAAPAVPQGWKLVPVEPTPDMEGAGRVNMAYGSCTARQVWIAMLAATPAAPSQPVTLTPEEITQGYAACPVKEAPAGLWFEAGARFAVAALREKQAKVTP